MCAAFSQVKVRDWLRHHRRAEEAVEVEDLSDRYGCLVLAGRRSRDVLRQLTQAPLDNDAFPWLRAREIEVAGAPLRALRVSYVGELGWELHLPMADMPRVYEALQEAGAPYGIEDFGSYALNALRLEKGFKGASELTNEVTLPEADVMRFVKLDKGDFIGRAQTMESEEGTLPWLCVYLEVDCADADPLGGETVFRDGRPVGQVSSGGYGHCVKKSLAFAYVTPESAAPGTELEVAILDERRAARVLAEPAYDPLSERPRTDA